MANSVYPTHLYLVIYWWMVYAAVHLYISYIFKVSAGILFCFVLNYLNDFQSKCAISIVA